MTLSLLQLMLERKDAKEFLEVYHGVVQEYKVKRGFRPAHVLTKKKQDIELLILRTLFCESTH